MTKDTFSNAMGELSEKYIAEVLGYSKGARPFRRLPLALIAALMALLLLGAGVAAVIYGGSIQSWFAHQWERVTGQSMTESHSAVVEHLSQEIGVSHTVGETIVTVDSATVGDDIIYLLLRVEGRTLNRRHTYYFEELHMEADPDPLADAAGMGAMGLHFHGLDGDGAALFLMEYEYGSRKGFQPDTRPLEVQVSLRDFLRTGKNKVLEEGKWTLAFTLDRSQLPEAVPLPDTEITAFNGRGELVTVRHTDMELTSTGIRFLCDLSSVSPGDEIDYGGLVEAPEHIAEMTGSHLISQMYVVLESGAVIEDGGGTGIFLKDTNQLSCSFHWRLPINLEEATAIQIGQTRIPVP